MYTGVHTTNKDHERDLKNHYIQQRYDMISVDTSSLCLAPTVLNSLEHRQPNSVVI